MNEALKIYIKIFAENIFKAGFLVYALYRVYCGYKNRNVGDAVFWVFLSLVTFALLLSSLLS